MILISPTRPVSPQWRSTPHHADRTQTRRGMTLIELVMVLLLIGILTAVAVPRVAGQLHTQAVDSVIQLLETDLRSAQQTALTRSATITVDLSTVTDSWTLKTTQTDPATTLRTRAIAASPWNCDLSEILEGTSKTSVRTTQLRINGAGVFQQNVILTITSGSASSRVTLDAATGIISTEQVTR